MKNIAMFIISFKDKYFDSQHKISWKDSSICNEKHAGMIYLFSPQGLLLWCSIHIVNFTRNIRALFKVNKSAVI